MLLPCAWIRRARAIVELSWISSLFSRRTSAPTSPRSSCFLRVSFFDALASRSRWISSSKIVDFSSYFLQMFRWNSRKHRSVPVVFFQHRHYLGRNLIWQKRGRNFTRAPIVMGSPPPAFGSTSSWSLKYGCKNSRRFCGGKLKVRVKIRGKFSNKWRTEAESAKRNFASKYLEFKFLTRSIASRL